MAASSFLLQKTFLGTAVAAGLPTLNSAGAVRPRSLASGRTVTAQLDGDGNRWSPSTPAMPLRAHPAGHGLLRRRPVALPLSPKDTRPAKWALQAAAAAAADAGSSEPAKEVTPQFSTAFKVTRMITFISMFVGYASFYLTRNSLAYTAPAMVDAGVLDKIAVGGLTSVLPMAYGFSKGISGVLGGKTPPRILLACGLAVTALINIAFGSGNAYVWFLGCWAANGLLQGLGAPACARILTVWFTGKERGTYWGFWTGSHNVGGLLAPIIAGTAAKLYGWRWGMYAPGCIALCVAVMLLFLMKDDPESAGFPPVEAAKPKPAATETDEKKPSMLETFRDEVVKSPYLWLFAIAYFFTYVVRQGVTSWFIFYLKEMGVADAPVRVSGLEIGGLLGSLSSGYFSDLLVKRNGGNKAGNVGLRVRVVIGYTIMLAVALAWFSVCPNIGWLQWISVAWVGLALYGPQMLIGLCGAETVSKSAVSAAQGFLGWISYLGAANAGIPLALIVKNYGWNAYFTTLIGSCVILILLVLPMLNLKSFVQREAEMEALAA